MIVKNCDKCGNMIHTGKYFGGNCIFCNSKAAVVTQKSMSYVDTMIDSCERELKNGNYEAALQMYDINIEKFPNISSLYWGRFLAKNRMNSDFLVLANGLNFVDDEDFIAAYHFADKDEKICFDKLKTCRNEILDKLVDTIRKKEKEAIISTDVKNVQKKTYAELQELSKDLSEKMQILSQIEISLKNKITDCEATVFCLRSIVDNTVNNISGIRNEINGKSEVSNEKTLDYRVSMKKNLDISRDALMKISRLQDNKMFQEYKALEKQKDEAESKVYHVIDEIDSLNEKMSELLAQINNIKTDYSAAEEEAEKVRFSKAISLLGKDTVLKICYETLKQ
ncbi:MAG: coiled-coil domain-containing protein [Acutalibacteraceae bacterium]